MSETVIASLLMQLVLSFGGLDELIVKAGVKAGSSQGTDYYCIEASNSEEIRKVLKQGAVEFNLVYEETGPQRTCLRGEVWKEVSIELSEKEERMVRNEMDFRKGLWIVYLPQRTFSGTPITGWDLFRE